MKATKFFEIGEYTGYSVNEKGEVKNIKTNSLVKVEENGTVRMTIDGKRITIKVADLVAKIPPTVEKAPEEKEVEPTTEGSSEGTDEDEGYVFTDKNNKEIKVGDKVAAFKDGKWRPGKIESFKRLAQDEYSKVLIDGERLTKLYHNNDVKFVSRDGEEAPKESEEAPKESEEAKKTSKAGKTKAQPKERKKREPKEKANYRQPNDAAKKIIEDKEMTKSDKIRKLLAMGYIRKEVSIFLGIRYQHVRNVEVYLRKKGLGQDLASA